MEYIMWFIIFTIIVIIIVLMCNKEKFGLSTGVTFPPVPGTITQNADSWQFIPSTGYFGPVKINYLLTDTKSSVPSSLTLKIDNVLQAIEADSPNVTFAPIDPYATSFPNYFRDSGDKYYFGFSADSLFNMVKLKGGEINQNIDKIVFSNVTSSPQITSTLTYVSGMNLGNLNLSATIQSSDNVIISPVTSTNAVPSNAVTIDTNKLFVFSCANTNPSNIQISIEFYFIDSVNYGQTVAPGSSSLYPLTGPFTLSFTVPVLYRTPKAIPVDLTSTTFLENNPISLNNQQLVGTSVKSPTGENLIASNLTLATCSPGSAISLVTKNCASCPGGTYNDNQFGYGSCIDCPGGYFCPAGSKSTTICPIGFYCPPKSINYIMCPNNGTTSTTGSVSATMCSLSIRYLVVAGGGGGGYGGGGGGGGGVLTGTLVTYPSTILNITVGEGGAGGSMGWFSNGSYTGFNGSNSSLINGNINTITAIGGGGGGGSDNSSGKQGGSGGGGGYTGIGGAGTSGQGNKGGNGGGAASSSTGGSGGGGGAGGEGTSTIYNGIGYIGGNGGIGLASDITGTSIQYGGGGGGYLNKTVNTGGGGNSDTLVGEQNRGGGGGVSGDPFGPNGAKGGSGVVILRIPIASYSNKYSGDVEISDAVPSFKILKFKSGTGTYTA